jgi:hypothetical protein
MLGWRWAVTNGIPCTSCATRAPIASVDATTTVSPGTCRATIWSKTGGMAVAIASATT